MKAIARKSLILAAAVAAMTVAVPQASAQSCQRGGYYRPYPQVRKVYLPVRHVQPAPVVAVQQTAVHVQPDAGMQLADIRLVDAGVPGQVGPTIRVVFHNASPFAASGAFDIVLAAAIDDQFNAELPLTGQRVTEIAPGQTSVVDLQLPPQAMEMQYPGEVRPAPFQNLIVMIAKARDLQGNPQLEQLAIIPRLNLRIVDFTIDPTSQPVAPSGAVITLTGEGFGTQPGQSFIAMGGLKLAGEIVNWSSQGVQVRLPQLALTQAAVAEVTVIRGDGAAAGMALQITPAQAAPVDQAAAAQQANALPVNAGQQAFDAQQQAAINAAQQGALPQQGAAGQQLFNQQQQQAAQAAAQQGGFPVQGQGPIR